MHFAQDLTIQQKQARFISILTAALALCACLLAGILFRQVSRSEPAEQPQSPMQMPRSRAVWRVSPSSGTPFMRPATSARGT